MVRNFSKAFCTKLLLFVLLVRLFTNNKAHNNALFICKFCSTNYADLVSEKKAKIVCTAELHKDFYFGVCFLFNCRYYCCGKSMPLGKNCCDCTGYYAHLIFKKLCAPFCGLCPEEPTVEQRLERDKWFFQVLYFHFFAKFLVIGLNF